MRTRNVTIRLDSDLMQQAQARAAANGESLSRWLARLVREKIDKDAEYETAMKEVLDVMEQGFDLGGGPYPGRDELYRGGRFR